MLLFLRKFPWNWVFLHFGKVFQLLYGENFLHKILLQALGFSLFQEEVFTASAHVAVRTGEWAQLWNYSVAPIISQISVCQSFVRLCCIADCCCFWGQVREQGKKETRTSTWVLESLCCCYSILSNWFW